MPIPAYPFIEIVSKDIFLLRSENSVPRVWLRVVNPHNLSMTYTTALIDTGSHDCLFPADWAEALGYDLESTPPEEIDTANGITLAYPHLTNVTVLDVLPDGQANKGKNLIPLGDIQVRYAKGLNQFLLGRSTFLSRYILSIDYPERKFSIRLPGHTEQPDLYS